MLFRSSWRAPGNSAKILAKRVTLQPERCLKLVESQSRYLQVLTSDFVLGLPSRASSTSSDAWSTRAARAAQACSLRRSSHTARLR